MFLYIYIYIGLCVIGEVEGDFNTKRLIKEQLKNTENSKNIIDNWMIKI